MAPSYPQQQHDALHAASAGKRKHLNLLLFDQSSEIAAIYSGTGRVPHYTLSPKSPIMRTGQIEQRTINPFAIEQTTRRIPEFQPPAPVTADAFYTVHQRSPSSLSVMNDAQYSQSFNTASSSNGSPGMLHSSSFASSTSSSKPAPWLMPWQTGDREAGKRMAGTIRKSRTPSGAFANFDIAKAVK